MPLATCTYCRRARATSVLFASDGPKYCIDCTLCSKLIRTIKDLKVDIAMETSLERLRRALDWELDHGPRTGVLNLLLCRIQCLERAAQ